jgi:hypothetical protein
MNKKIFPSNAAVLRGRYTKRMLIIAVPALCLLFAALTVTLFVVIPDPDGVPRIINRLILSGCSFIVLYLFAVSAVGGILSAFCVKMHKSHTFIQINEKSLVISEYADTDFLTGREFRKLWVCDIRAVDDIIDRKDTITFKLKGSSGGAQFFREPCEWLTMHESENGLVFDDWTTVSRAEAVYKFTVPDNFLCTDRLIQRIFLVAGNVREREARRARFREEMLERARKAPRFSRLRDRYRPAAKSRR